MNKTTRPYVCIVIPIHNGKVDTLRCLESLGKLDYPNFDVIITDDGSTDGSAEAIKEQYPETILVYGDGSLWWSGGINRAIEEGLRRGGDYYLLLNNDDVVPPELLNILVDYCEANPGTIAGSQIYDLNEPGKCVCTAAQAGWWWKGIYDVQMDVNRDDPPVPAVALSGQGVLVPRECLENAGLMDEKYFPLYSGDVEFSFRMRYAGYPLVILPAAVVWNNQKTTGFKVSNCKSLSEFCRLLFHRRSDMNIQSKIRLYLRHWPRVCLPTALLGLSYQYLVMFYKFIRVRMTNKRQVNA